MTERMVARTPEETAAAGERLGARLPAGAVVACVGELGAGKTCFVQGLARGLGVTAVVTSPTFVLVNVYRGRVPVYHLDAYRTDNLTEVVDLGIDEMMAGQGVTLIEWADKVPAAPSRRRGAGDDLRAGRRAARDRDRGRARGLTVDRAHRGSSSSGSASSSSTDRCSRSTSPWIRWRSGETSRTP